MKRISLPLFIAFMLLLQGCIKEDLSNCKSELLLSFRYTLNNQYTNLFGEKMSKVTVYVFDSNGKYVDRFSEEGNQLTNEYVMHIPLPEGTYRVVAYGGEFGTYSAGELDRQLNTLNETLRKGVTDINDFRTELKNVKGSDGYLSPLAMPDDLYAGLTTHAVSSMSSKTITPIDLIKDTKKIKVKISGTSNISGALEVYAMAINGRYLSDNSIDGNHGTFKYTPIHSVQQPDRLEVDLRMMRLVLGQAPRLVIRNSTTSEVIYDENMIDQILQTQKYTSQEDLDREDEFVFEIVIDRNVVVSVSINGWKVNNVTPDYR